MDFPAKPLRWLFAAEAAPTLPFFAAGVALTLPFSPLERLSHGMIHFF
jgi:hypothetical protein